LHSTDFIRLQFDYKQLQQFTEQNHATGSTDQDNMI